MATPKDMPGGPPAREASAAGVVAEDNPYRIPLGNAAGSEVADSTRALRDICNRVGGKCVE